MDLQIATAVVSTVESNLHLGQASNTVPAVAEVLELMRSYRNNRGAYTREVEQLYLRAFNACALNLLMGESPQWIAASAVLGGTQVLPPVHEQNWQLHSAIHHNAAITSLRCGKISEAVTYAQSSLVSKSAWPWYKAQAHLVIALCSTGNQRKGAAEQALKDAGSLDAELMQLAQLLQKTPYLPVPDILGVKHLFLYRG